MLPDKQEAHLKDIYHRMPKEAELLIGQGFHNDAFDVVLWEFCFARSVDFWMRVVISTYQMVINNIYLYEGDIDGNLIDFLEIIESKDNLKLYSSVWEVDDDGKVVLTKMARC